MTTINEELRIYHIALAELTMRQIREYCKEWDDTDELGGLIMFYDRREDRVLFAPRTSERQINFCTRILSEKGYGCLDKMNRYIAEFKTEASRSICNILKEVIAERAERERKTSLEVTPGSKFISVDGDIFQISKIVSVKKRDEGNRCYIEFYITNKRASVRKDFISKQLRDSEFLRIQKLLESAA